MINNSPPTDWQTFAIHAKREQKAKAVKTKVEDHGFRYQPASPIKCQLLWRVATIRLAG